MKEIGALERIRTSDRLVRRTNKNAEISVVTGLAFVAFAGLCRTYQDRLRQKLGRPTSVQQIYLGDRGETIGAPEKIRGREMSPGEFDRLLGRFVSKGLMIRGYFSSSQLTCCSFPIMLRIMLRLLLIMMTLLMVQVAHVQPVHATMDIDQSHMSDATHCVNDDVSMSDHVGGEVSDHCNNAHFSCSLSGPGQFNAKHIPNMWARMVHPSDDPKYTSFKIERPPKA